MYPSVQEEKIGYVYVVMAANREFLKIGSSYRWSNFRERVTQLKRHFLADYSESICFRYETEAQARHVETVLKAYFDCFRFTSPLAFPGHTELYWGSIFLPILLFIERSRFEGYISMNDLWSELEMEDYEPPSKITLVTSLTKMILGVIQSCARARWNKGTKAFPFHLFLKRLV